MRKMERIGGWKKRQEQDEEDGKDGDQWKKRQEQDEEDGKDRKDRKKDRTG